MTITSPGAAAGRGTTAAPALYPTKTRLELLHAVERGEVIEGITDDHTYMLRDPDVPLKVCARIEELNAAGWVVLPEQDDPVTWHLTDLGRQVVDGSES